jgi:hypothetical protein
VLKYTIDRSEESQARGVITLEEWKTFLHRFGPVQRCIGGCMVDNIMIMMMVLGDGQTGRRDKASDDDEPIMAIYCNDLPL